MLIPQCWQMSHLSHYYVEILLNYTAIQTCQFLLDGEYNRRDSWDFQHILHSNAALFTLHHRVANYMNILQLNNVASSETHYFPWFKGRSFANLLCSVKSWFLISWLAEWESVYCCHGKLCCAHWSSRHFKRGLCCSKVLTMLNQSNHCDQTFINWIPRVKKETRNKCSSVANTCPLIH